jgi:hypothetical protein
MSLQKNWNGALTIWIYAPYKGHPANGRWWHTGKNEWGFGILSKFSMLTRCVCPVKICFKGYLNRTDERKFLDSTPLKDLPSATAGWECCWTAQLIQTLTNSQLKSSVFIQQSLPESKEQHIFSTSNIYTASAKLSTLSTTNSPAKWNNSYSSSSEYSLIDVWNALSTQHTTVCNKIKLFCSNLLCKFYHPCTKKWFLLIQECM